LLTEIERDKRVGVVLFDSADPDFFLAHYDIAGDPAELEGVETTAGRHPFTELHIRLSKSPAVTTAPLPAVTVANPVMVLCNRTTIIPEVTDYRVLTELRLPLSIRAGQRTLFLGAAGGKLQVGLPDGQVTPEETKTLEDRLAEMQTAMAKPAPKK